MVVGNDFSDEVHSCSCLLHSVMAGSGLEGSGGHDRGGMHVGIDTVNLGVDCSKWCRRTGCSLLD